MHETHYYPTKRALSVVKQVPHFACPLTLSVILLRRRKTMQLAPNVNWNLMKYEHTREKVCRSFVCVPLVRFLQAESHVRELQKARNTSLAKRVASSLQTQPVYNR